MPIVKGNAPNAIYDSPIEKFKGERMVPIDVSIWAHQKFRQILPAFVKGKDADISDEEDGSDSDKEELTTGDDLWIIDWQGFEKRWLSQLLEIGWTFLKKKITPIFIFDGKPSSLKLEEQADREKKRNRAEEILQECKEAYYASLGEFKKDNARDKYRRAFIGATRFRFSMMDNLRELLIDLGFPVLRSIEESDFLIAGICRANLTRTAFSTDTDLCIYGVNYLLTNYYQGTFTILDRKCFLEEAEISEEQLVDLAILLGCDYNSSIPSVGQKTALKLIREHGKLELLPAKYDQRCLRRTLIRDRFTNIPPWEELVEYEKSSISSGDVDLLVFSKEKFKKKGLKILSKFGLHNKWEEFLEMVKTEF